MKKLLLALLFILLALGFILSVVLVWCSQGAEYKILNNYYYEFNVPRDDTLEDDTQYALHIILSDNIELIQVPNIAIDTDNIEFVRLHNSGVLEIKMYDEEFSLYIYNYTAFYFGEE